MNNSDNYPKILEQLVGAYNKLNGKVDNVTFVSIAQSILRSFDALNSEYHVLHASAALDMKNRCIIFGDDGSQCKGKTFSSLFIASESRKYLSDEYVLINKNSSEVYGNGNIPINLKGDTARFFKDELEMEFKDNKIIFANDYFQIVEKIVSNILVIPFFEQAKNEIYEVTDEEKNYLLKATFYGHNAKYLNSNFDRLSILRNTDLNIAIDMKGTLELYPEVNMNFKVYRMHVKDLKEIPNLINSI